MPNQDRDFRLIFPRLRIHTRYPSPLPPNEDDTDPSQHGPGAENPPRPSFDDLLEQSDGPVASAWGVHGINDELGTLNLLTPERIKSAAALVVSGHTVPLNLQLDAIDPPVNPIPKATEHQTIPKGQSHHQKLEINPQCSSHWLAPRYQAYQNSGCYYGNVTQDDISGEAKNNKLGAQNMAAKTITGRGVLLDFYAWSQDHSCPSPFTAYPIPLNHIYEIAASQNTKFLPGDILMIRTGWLKSYKALSPSDRRALPNRPVCSSIGVQPSEEMIRWHWDKGFAAVASDTPTYEAWPSAREWQNVTIHEVLLAGWGMPIGACFDLEELSEVCKKEGRYEFFFASVPLNVNGGVASPSSAVAIF